MTMPSYIRNEHRSFRPGCACCTPTKSGDGGHFPRQTATLKVVKQTAKTALRMEGKTAIRKEVESPLELDSDDLIPFWEKEDIAA